jgi:lipoyl synthase
MHQAKPSWLNRPLPSGSMYRQTLEILEKGGVGTVCRESGCPNRGECFSRGTATFLILGIACTRACRFCGIGVGPVEPPDAGEPARLAATARNLGLRNVVITSVTRDDLPDGGAGHFARTVAELRERIPSIGIETLIPDFYGSSAAIRTMTDAAPDILSHNLDTMPRLFPLIRPRADYLRSLEVLRSIFVSAPGIPVKSGLMLGLGEHAEEIRAVLEDLREAGCSILTLGQYLRPSAGCVPVARYVHPEEFAEWRAVALEMGFASVQSGPLVRSSYRAWEWNPGGGSGESPGTP